MALEALVWVLQVYKGRHQRSFELLKSHETIVVGPQAVTVLRGKLSEGLELEVLQEKTARTQHFSSYQKSFNFHNVTIVIRNVDSVFVIGLVTWYGVLLEVL